MGIPLLRGRFFTSDDTNNAEPVIVIDNVMAKAYFRDQDPIGQTLLIPHWGTVRIIGVVGHVKHWGLDDSGKFVRNQTYSSLYQLPDRYVPAFYSDINIAVRTALAPAAVLPAIKSAIYGTGDKQPVYGIETMHEIVSESMASQRLPMFLLGAFAILALALACVGIYGVISYSVAQRVRELGVRIALGAQKGDVLRMIIGQALGLAVLGLLVGTAAALGLSRVLSSFSHLLYGVKAGDPITFAWVSFGLIAMAILAAYIPARRATKVDPMVALRHE
jgi:predicted permease